MKRLIVVGMMMAILLMTCSSCSMISVRGAGKAGEAETGSRQFWGSYTDEKTYSYDRKYYALQTVKDRMIIVTVYLTETGKEVAQFSPARSMDFWGICWERDSYNIWIQSSDIGICCYEYRDGAWERNGSLKEPDYIISRYDEAYRNNPALWGTFYVSPTD